MCQVAKEKPGTLGSLNCKALQSVLSLSHSILSLFGSKGNRINSTVLWGFKKLLSSIYAKEHNIEHFKFDLHTILDIALLMYLLLLVQWYSFYLMLPRITYLSIKRMHFFSKSLRHFCYSHDCLYCSREGNCKRVFI